MLVLLVPEIQLYFTQDLHKELNISMKQKRISFSIKMTILWLKYPRPSDFYKKNTFLNARLRKDENKTKNNKK